MFEFFLTYLSCFITHSVTLKIFGYLYEMNIYSTDIESFHHDELMISLI